MRVVALSGAFWALVIGGCWADDSVTPISQVPYSTIFKLLLGFDGNTPPIEGADGTQVQFETPSPEILVSSRSDGLVNTITVTELTRCVFRMNVSGGQMLLDATKGLNWMVTELPAAEVGGSTDGFTFFKAISLSEDVSVIDADGKASLLKERRISFNGTATELEGLLTSVRVQCAGNSPSS